MEKKYVVEGIGEITEEQLKVIYENENTNLSYKDWKNDILNDDRSAIKEK